MIYFNKSRHQGLEQKTSFEEAEWRKYFLTRF